MNTSLCRASATFMGRIFQICPINEASRGCEIFFILQEKLNLNILLLIYTPLFE